MAVSSPTLLKLPFSTYLLSLAQTINLTMAVLSVSVGALVGSSLAPMASMGTVPYGLQFVAVMLCTYVASLLMQKKGRAFVFYIASVFLFIASMLGFFAIESHSFILICASHFFLGVYIACANFYRFAATDNLPNELKSKAISWVVLGGVFAAIIGPFLAGILKDPWPNYQDFSLCYAVMSVFAVLNVFVIFFWQKTQVKHSKNYSLGSAESAVLRKKIELPIFAAILTSSVGYLVMNLLMIQSSLLMNEVCSFVDANRAIQWHVLAMFLPSFFTGKLINKWGLWPVVHIGMALLVGSALWGLFFGGYSNIVIELIALGLGWNLTYIGGSAMLAAYMPSHLKHKLQGINDSMVALCATVGALSPSLLYSYMGWKNTHIAVLMVCLLVFVINIVFQMKSIANKETL
jgi:MFS family permease